MEKSLTFPFFNRYGEKKSKLVITLTVLGLFYVFYLSQNLFYVNGLNDFDEYFIRAEMWSNGEWTWAGGPDKLLSLIMYLPIYLFKNDFFSFYRTTQFILITILFSASALFVLKENQIFPDFSFKLLLTCFLLSMPFFMVQTITVDESILFAICLLFFLSTYNNKYLGVLSVVFFLSRPESVMLFFFYIFFFIIDKKNRKSIAINFSSFLILLLFYKFYLEPKVLLHSAQTFSDYQIPETATKSVQSGVFSVISKMFAELYELFPLIMGYTIEILQNYILVLLFLIGFIASLLNRKMWIFYGFFLFYIVLVFAINAFLIKVDLAQVLGKVPVKFVNNTIGIVNGRQMEYNIFGHSRYRVFLYPAIAAFVVAGTSFVINLFRKYVMKVKEYKPVTKKVKKSKKENEAENVDNTLAKTKIEKFFEKYSNFLNLPAHSSSSLKAVFVVILILLMHNLYTYSNFSGYYRIKNQMKDIYINDYYHLGFKIREKVKPDDIVLMPNLCNCNISFIIEFLTFSGNRYVMTPMCAKCENMYMINGPNKKYLISAVDIEKMIPSRTIIFDRYSIDYQKTFNPTSVSRINKLFNKFDLSMLDSLNIRFVITQQELKKPFLEKIYQKGELFLYENANVKK